MQGLEIVMDIDTLEIYEVIDHDKEVQEEEMIEPSPVVFQLNLFESMGCQNTS
ncbi:hypothetical protein StDouc24_02710 [Streptococcus thermophilus]|uniref:hypothetical protein n=1 Tax=Streptococcus thermophilus TaxID=1308 RepID=UPI001C64B419|nr:hypothetical protein [Streptococcus thermophilus]MBW7797494.1 hypothetical protein [Streptococcus thermophilus]